MVRLHTFFALLCAALNSKNLAIRQDAEFHGSEQRFRAPHMNHGSFGKFLAGSFAFFQEKMSELEAGVILSLREGRFQLQATQLELQETKAEVKRMQETHPTRKGSLLFENDGEKRLSFQQKIRNSPEFSKVAVSARGMLLAQGSSTSEFDKLKKAIFMRSVRHMVALNSGEQSLEDKQSEGEFIDIYHDSDNASSVSELKTTGLGADCTFPSSEGVELNDKGLQLNLGHFACSLNWDFGWGISGNANLFDMNMNFGTFEFNDIVKTIFDWAGSFAHPVELLTRILKSGLSGIGSAVNFVLTTIADAGVTKALAAVNAVCGLIDDHTPNGNGEVALLSTQTRNDDHGSPTAGSPTATTSAGVDGEFYCFTLELSFNVPPSLPLIVVSVPLDFLPPTITTKLQVCLSLQMGLGSDLAKIVLEIAGMGMPLIEVTQPIGSGMHFLPDGCIPFKNQVGALASVASASRRAAYTNQATADGRRKLALRNTSKVKVRNFDFKVGQGITIHRDTSGDEARSWLGALMRKKGNEPSIGSGIRNNELSARDRTLFTFDMGKGGPLSLSLAGLIHEGLVQLDVEIKAGLSADDPIIDVPENITVFDLNKVVDNFFNNITCMEQCAKDTFKSRVMELLNGSD